MLQKHLKATRLSTAGATFARFIYSAPLVLVLIWAYAAVSGQPAPAMPGAFWAYALTGGLAQIFATLCVVALFAERNFSVGITLKKTETILTAIVGFVLLGDRVSAIGAVAVLIGFFGVALLSAHPERSSGASAWERLATRAAGLGLASGGFFAIAAVGYRGASLSLGSGDVLLRAGTTLAVVTTAQTLAMGIWFALRDPGQVGAVLRSWRVAGLVGLTSMVGSILWFSAFTLQNAAYVHALGQVEVILSLLATVVFFRERVTARELFGMGLLSASILVLVLFI